jgi:prepilin-type N-terminal cleavage/methylation domain-containing protein
MITKRTYCRRGVTLVEVMVASVVLTITLLGFLASFDVARRSENLSANTFDGIHQARSILEELRTVGYYASELSLGTHSVSNGFYVVSNNTDFAQTKDVYLTLRWVEPGGSRTASLYYATSMTESMH